MIALHVSNLLELRDQLLQQTRQASHHALAAAIRHWRRTYASLHFDQASYARYGSRPALYNAEHPFSARGQSALGLTPPYSTKALMQRRAGHPVTDAPLTFSGRTREAILRGAMPIRRRGRHVSGHFTSAGITRDALLRDGGKLLAQLQAITPAELSDLARHAVRELALQLARITADQAPTPI